MSNKLFDEQKNISLLLVGKWYCKEINQHLEFSFQGNILGLSEVIIKNTEQYHTKYSVSPRPHHEEDRETGLFYISIEPYPNRNFNILSIDKDKLVISEYIIENAKTINLEPSIYIKQNDFSQGEKILQELGEI